MSDEKRTPDELQLSSRSFERRAFLKVLGAAFSTAILPEVLSACADAAAVPTSVSEVAALTARQTIAVVRPEDHLVLNIGLVNLKRSITGTLVKLTASLPAFLIVDFPPQAIVEDAAAGAGVPTDFYASSWLSGSSRLIFSLPDAYVPVPFSLSAILGVCGTSSLVVSDPMKTSIAAPVSPAIDPAASILVDAKLANLAAGVDPAAAARKMAFDQTLSFVQPLLQAYPGLTGDPPGISDGSVSLVELPYRLQLSPNGVAGWSHANDPVQGASGAFEIWHTTLGVRSAAANVAGAVDERNALLRTARALATRDATSGVAWDPQRPGAPVTLQNPTITGDQRKRIVKLSSQDAGASAVQIHRMMLSSLGGHLDARGDFVDPQHVVDGWIERMTGGRENYVEIASAGVLLPFGNAIRKFQITKRNEDPTKGPIGSLYAFDVFVIGNPITSYRPADYQASTRGKLVQWPFAMVELTQTQFIAQKSTAAAYRPLDMSGTPIAIPAVGYDQRGHAVHFFVPLYFVGPTALPLTSTSVSDYRGALGSDGITAPAPNNASVSLDVAMGGQRIAYAPSDKDDTTYATRALYFDLSPATGEAFPFVPIVTGAEIDVEALHSFTSASSIQVTYHARYASGAGLDTTSNKSQLLFSLVDAVKADFTNRPDGGTGFVAPNMRFNAISRTTGPTYDFTAPPLVSGALVGATSATTAAAGDGGFDPKSYLNLAAAELDKIKIFGVFRIIDIVKAVDPNEAANDVAGLAQEAEEAALKYAPKFVAEGLSEVEKIVSAVLRIKAKAELIWTNAQELLGADFVQAIAAGNAPPAVSGSLATAAGIADPQRQIVVAKLTDIVTKLKTFYTTLTATINHIHKLEIRDLAGMPAPQDGSIPELITNATALKDAVVDLADYGARAAVDAKAAIVAASNQIASQAPVSASPRLLTAAAGPSLKVTNSPLQIIPGLFAEFLSTLSSLTDVVGDVKNASAVKDRITHLFNDAKQAVAALRDMTVHVDWQPKIGSYFVPGTDWLVFRPASQHGLSLSLEARTKAKEGKPAGVDVNCRLDQFDLCLGPLDAEQNPLVAMQFDHISFVAKAGTKPDCDVKINGIKFGGPLSFLETLRKVIPLDGFSDPPYLNVDSKGIHAGFTLQIPNVAVGIFSIENIAFSAKLEVPFFTDGAASTLTFTFSFCDKDHPFLITVSMLGGGGYFVMSLSPHGIESLEASIAVGAQIAISLLDVAQGSVSIMVGITFTIKDVTDASGNALGKDISLTAFLRLHGQVDVLGIVSASIDLHVGMTYDITTKTMIAEGVIKVDVSLLFFSVHESFSFRKEFHACNNDPTLRELMPPNASNVSQFWNDYSNAFA